MQNIIKKKRVAGITIISSRSKVIKQGLFWGLKNLNLFKTSHQSIITSKVSGKSLQTILQLQQIYAQLPIIVQILPTKKDHLTLFNFC